MSTQRPVSRHHVLTVTPLLADVPTHLVKTLMCLAAHANHATGRSRPGQQVMKHWSIPYSTWHKHCVELSRRGLIRQVVRGNSKHGLAAEYELLWVPALTSDGPTTTQGQGILKVSDDNTNPQGGGVTRESRQPWKELNDFEAGLWSQLADKMREGLDAPDTAALNANMADFDQRLPLQRTVARLICRGDGDALVSALTERRRAGEPVYAGARNAPAALFGRLRTLAEQRGVRVWDGTPVQPQELVDYEAALERLGDRLSVPGDATACPAPPAEVAGSSASTRSSSASMR